MWYRNRRQACLSAPSDPVTLLFAHSILFPSFGWLIIVHTVPWIIVIKRGKIKHFHLSLLAAYFSQSHWAEKVKRHRHRALAHDTNKTASPWLNIITHLRKWRAYICAALIHHLKNRRAESEKWRIQIEIDERKRRKEPKSHWVMERGRQTEKERGMVSRWGPWRAFVLWTRRVSEAALGSWFKATNSKSIFYSLSKQTHTDTYTGPKKGHTHSSNHKQADNTRHFVVDLWCEGKKRFSLPMHVMLEIGESLAWYWDCVCVCVCMKVCVSVWPMPCFFNELGLHTSLIGWHSKGLSKIYRPVCTRTHTHIYIHISISLRLFIHVLVSLFH